MRGRGLVRFRTWIVEGFSTELRRWRSSLKNEGVISRRIMRKGGVSGKLTDCSVG